MSNEWQPIETIPMDGTPVLVWAPVPFSRRSHIQVANFSPNCRIVGNVFAFDLRKEERPTHWRPLPSPPGVPV
jgi:hypothetical protein